MVEPVHNILHQEESFLPVNSREELHGIDDNFYSEEIIMTEPPLASTLNQVFEPSNLEKEQTISLSLAEPVTDMTPPNSESLTTIQQSSESTSDTSAPPTLSTAEKPTSPAKTVEFMETNENSYPVSGFSSPKKTDKRPDSPIHLEKKLRREEKPTIMEQIIADAEKHEASPSPPPPPVISDKFKEIKQSSLSRLRRVGRPRDDLEAESPEPSDIDLRTQIQPPTLIKDPKNEVLGLADKDVDLRNLPASPTKKRPSIENLLDVPPAKKSKAEVMDELFGSEDVDLRPVLCPPPPSPPPPPVISSSPPPESAGEKLWARYKQTKPDTYKSKYTPSRRDRAPSVDKFNRSRYSTDGDNGSRRSSYQKDIDMRAQFQGVSDLRYKDILLDAHTQHKRGDLKEEEYKKILNQVFTMNILNEKHQLEMAQRRDEEEAAQAEHLDPISDEDISGGSLSGVEDAPSPSESYSGADDIDEPSTRKADKPVPTNELGLDSHGDIDIRIPPADVIRVKQDIPRVTVAEDRSWQKSRGSSSPYSKDSEKERHHGRREDLRAQKRERRAHREEGRESRYRNQRYNEDSWSPTPPVEGAMEVDPPRVPPLHFREDPFPSDTPPLRPPGPWDPQRMPGPNPWMPGMAPPSVRGPPVMGMRPQDRFMAPRWRQPAPGLRPAFDAESGPGPRFNRFAPPPPSRFPGPPVRFWYEVPPTDPSVLKEIEMEPTRSINIDGSPRDIRFYGITAVALMSWDDPREISFQNGSRRVIIDDRDSIVVHFNAPPQEMVIDGKPRRVRFGAPTRELYIDNQWFEVFFGGPPVSCNIAGVPHLVKLEGPPPPVRPGVSRRDLVAGKITLIIDAEYFFPVYLDALPQKFEVKGVPYIIRFVEALQKTVINGVGFKSEFGGIPRPIILNGTKHFFRLTGLPRGVTPGFISIVNMENGPKPPSMPAPPQLPASLEQAVEQVPADMFLQPPMPSITVAPRLSPEMLNRDEMEPLVQPMPPPSTSAGQPPLDFNIGDMFPNVTVLPDIGKSVDYSYSVDSENSNPATGIPSSSSAANAVPSLTGGEINVTELLQKLMATGIVPTLADESKDKSPDKPVAPEQVLIKPVDFRKPDSLKIRQTALVSHLYSGIQCNSCGVRFPPEQTMRYSQHLDWHFRQNRRDKDSTRTALSRRYYYDVNDWVQFEEIEDLEERAQPWFDMQDGSGGGADEAAPTELVSVAAAEYPEDAACHICHDKFESFYNEEKEEWQLRNAVDSDGNLVHPVCLEDQKAAAEKPIVVDDIDITGDEPKEEEVKENKEEPPKEEDDDIMEVTDIEFIKPVFPVEDLTVSDSESVAGDDEKNQEMETNKEEIEDPEKKDAESSAEEKEDDVSPESADKEEVKDDTQGEEETTTVSDKIMENENGTKDEDTQDSLVIVNKEEDSVPSETEIMEVVKNIKKDPDALGGEFEESTDPDVKREKGEVPLPAPIVDTTHATVTCLIDGNVEFDETPQQLNVGGPAKIKINITKPSSQSALKETKESKETETGAPDVEVTNVAFSEALHVSLNAQPPPPGEEPIPLYVKPRLLGKKLTDLPPVLKGKEMSGLCSIM